MPISIIVAMARNRVIGRDNELPWRLSDDLKLFKKHTMGNTIVMGRKTWQSIGRPLPGRTNVVLTRDAAFSVPGCEVVHSFDEILALDAPGKEIFIIGGAAVYANALPHASQLYLTEVEADIQGDVFFPPLDLSLWQETQKQHFLKNANNQFNFVFRLLEKKRKQ
ncbi:MAG: dihydrofolate reductase [Deferribacteres bacterium]|nr:dihydrofolate reductase [candidate division KSB1 bacterium]MCB9504018.1 dihydrofolate reductase [Deferribacteres bacterium]